MAPSSDGPDDETLTVRPERSTPGAMARCYLLVIEGNTSVTFHLPPDQEVIVGRSTEADLRLEDRAVSRAHARLTVMGREVRLEDLGSHNGTRVNGERIGSPRLLLSGDVISICGATLVFHRHAGPPESRPVFGLLQLRQHLDEEVDRSLRYLRELTLLCVRFGGEEIDRAQLGQALGGRLRVMDVAAWDGADRLFLLLPELARDEAAVVAEDYQQLFGAMQGGPREARVGYATCPADGCDSDTLLWAARSAAERVPGTAGTQAPSVVEEIRLGGRVALVAAPAMRQIYAQLERLGQSDMSVLLCGETGTGKELAAEALHHFSPRREQPLVVVNCATLPEALVESELFGHRKGAFTGAVEDRTGLLESAHGGTVFFDEIGELPLGVQPKLLRLVEERELRRVGDVQARTIDVRIIAATNRDLEEEVRAGRFRKDLFFRLRASLVTVPPLRERTAELPMLARAFLSAACARRQRQTLEIAPAAMHRLLSYPWPGNVRELKNALEYVATTVAGPVMLSWHLEAQLGGRVEEAPVPAGGQRFRPIEEEVRQLERARMMEALEAAGGVQVRAAELIQMPIRTFTTKMKQYGLSQRPARP